MVAATEIVFEPLPIRRRTRVAVDANQYNVTASSRETRQIKAGTAYEAFKLSGFKEAIKIERISNLVQPLLSKEQFTDDVLLNLAGALVGVAPEDSDAFLRINQRRNIIVSADELDALMHTLQEIAAHAPAMNLAAMPTAATTAGGAVPGLTGMDVHGEGFDEIIPSSPAAKPAALSKSAESKETAKVESQVVGTTPLSATPLPERELSQEEIEKLLGGK